MKITRIAPVNGTELPVGWASLAGVAPEESVQIIIKPMEFNDRGFGVPVSGHAVGKKEGEALQTTASYLLRCKLFKHEQ